MSLMHAIDRMTDALAVSETRSSELMERLDHFETLAQDMQEKLDRIEEKLTEFEARLADQHDEIRDIQEDIGALVGTMPDLEEIADSLRRQERLTMLTEARTAMRPTSHGPVEYAF